MDDVLNLTILNFKASCFWGFLLYLSGNSYTLIIHIKKVVLMYQSTIGVVCKPTKLFFRFKLLESPIYLEKYVQNNGNLDTEIQSRIQRVAQHLVVLDHAFGIN